MDLPVTGENNFGIQYNPVILYRVYKNPTNRVGDCHFNPPTYGYLRFL